jgi:hypothetical protein
LTGIGLSVTIYTWTIDVHIVLPIKEFYHEISKKYSVEHRQLQS